MTTNTPRLSESEQVLLERLAAGPVQVDGRFNSIVRAMERKHVLVVLADEGFAGARRMTVAKA